MAQPTYGPNDPRPGDPDYVDPTLTGDQSRQANRRLQRKSTRGMAAAWRDRGTGRQRASGANPAAARAAVLQRLASGAF